MWQLSAWQLAAPFVLLLLPLPFLAARLLPADGRVGGALRVPGAIAASHGASDASSVATGGRRVAAWIAWIALVIALAGPRVVLPAQALPTTGRDLMVTLDLSGSMERTDFFLNGETARRLDAMKSVAATFIRARAGDRVGLIAYADQTYVVSPPSYDVEAVAKALDGFAVGLVGRSTAIGDGLGLALRRLSATDAKSRVVLLLSDGVNNAGVSAPKDVANLAKEMGVRVHTIAMGPRDIPEGDGNPDVVDVKTLREMAEITGGQTYRVKTTEDLQAAMAAVNQIEPTRSLAPPAPIWRELWPWPAALAFFAAAATALVRTRGG
ncbi:VWA domain-containing protein [Chenggangzhangella methanolivorans]|uniref:VWA domain-containing protein n=1 Tax=Chenggangzhangella methanolivorans TaxID=1437009 RepID=A0A9E6R814_9HYPH|nr:VWA domain-containing protein [Chenggangzhangella methanolivorans]QZN99920.1 VWA domain-containing protein [Chenggangzhangella methanolivorans]